VKAGFNELLARKSCERRCLIAYDLAKDANFTNSAPMLLDTSTPDAPRTSANAESDRQFPEHLVLSLVRSPAAADTERWLQQAKRS